MWSLSERGTPVGLRWCGDSLGIIFTAETWIYFIVEYNRNGTMKIEIARPPCYLGRMSVCRLPAPSIRFLVHIHTLSSFGRRWLQHMTASTIPPLSVWPCGTPLRTQWGSDLHRSVPIT